MSADLQRALGDYARLLQARGETHVLLSKEARSILRGLTAAPIRSAVARPPVTPVAATPKPENTLELAPLEISGSTKVEQLRNLEERAKVCVKCAHLAATRTQVVFGVGNPEAELMFVGEAPGADEDKKGEPFVGLAGQLLTKMIGAMGLSREQIYIANVLKCRPDMPPGTSGNRKPTPDEMKTCLPYLCAQIEIIRPKVLVALGSTAVEGLLGGKVTIGKMRGKFHEFRGVPLMPTFHPAYLLRNQSMAEKRKVWEDLLQVMEKLGLPISEKQQNYFLRSGS
jgi:DNA polymerase